MGKQTIKIGNAGGYWGDDPNALERQVFGGRLDYISLDFLAEITMSIMQKQKHKDPNLGYARDFLPMLEKVLPKLLEDKTTLITNAGGINPVACAEAIIEMADRLSLKPKIAIVDGDDILTRLDELQKSGNAFRNMETGEDFAPISKRIEAANIYFGAAPVVAALKQDVDIIITGRVTDTGITLAPMIYEFGWSFNDWDKLAQGIVAGHLLECGSQVSGGNFTDWHKVQSFDNMGFPIVEVHADSSFVITKHPNTGGLISVDTVREQLVYEMGDPGAYISPDVVADFSSIQLEELDFNRVRVSGTKGKPSTEFYKVSMAYTDGWKAVGSILVSGPEARAKAQLLADTFWKRCPKDFESTLTEFVGWNACHRFLVQTNEGNEILLRLAVRDEDLDAIAKFSKLVPALILGGPAGLAVIGGTPKPQRVVSYWPALMSKSAVTPTISVMSASDARKSVPFKMPETATCQVESSRKETTLSASLNVAEIKEEYANPEWLSLDQICLARSGDKGDTANIGVLARSKEAYEFLKNFLTPERMKSYFQELCEGEVIRYELAGLHAFNFLLEKSLGGGGTKTLRIDAQGKTFAQALIRQKAPIPHEIIKN